MADGSFPVCQDSEICLREVAHVHAVSTCNPFPDFLQTGSRPGLTTYQQDASLHVILSPADAATVIENGWAGRFGWAGRAAINGRPKGKVLPAGWILVYSPRDERELGIVSSIIKAGVAYALKV